MISREWNGDRRFECHNSPWRIAAHFFRRFNGHPLEFDGVPFGRNPHDRRHTSGQSGSNKVGGREGFSLALIIDRGIGFQFGFRRAMDGRAVQLPFISDGNFNQGSGSMLACARATGPASCETEEKHNSRARHCTKKNLQ